MATIVLAAAGAAIGAGFGGAVFGLSGAVIGRAVGATLGRVIDQRLLGAGSTVVESGRIDRFRLTGASEGTPIPRLWGRVRVGGQVIWATRFVERVRRRKVGGGKGAPKATVKEFSYSVSLAIALCEGEIVSVGRVWADGAEIARDDLTMRVYSGGPDQMPDPKIEAVEGSGQAPAYRGIAYVVIEDLELEPWGNRVPQFTFEVLRSAEADAVADLMQGVRAVALLPGSGEYALSTRPVTAGPQLPGLSDLPEPILRGISAAADGQGLSNVNTLQGRTDLEVSLDALTAELPNCGSVLLIVSWFGSDLRCADCLVRPKVEKAEGAPWRPWSAGGVDREEAEVVAQQDGRPVYGGTPSDDSVIEAIEALHAAGQAVVFYPFLLMEQLAGNGLPDPWTGAEDQPVLPWRGRITTSVAPGRDGSPDRTAEAEAEVAQFFGTVQPGHFALQGRRVVYSGPAEWSFRRMILHYAWLAKAAGGVDAFCVGSEMRGLTQIRGEDDVFPSVAQLRQLAADVRAILGPDVKISYAADWSEYFGYNAPEGNRYFHLDPFWADPEVDFVGIDNYMPLSDWRDGEAHADASSGSIYDLDYLKANVAGGEGYDWFYPGPAERAVQKRVEITDLEHGEPWVWRYKDLRGWWENVHRDRIDGVRQGVPTVWVPQSKPIWFTELGCPAVDKGTNQPNVFLDPKSSESQLPHFSNGRRDDLIQLQYHRAMIAHWADPAMNPVSEIYGGPMVDMDRAHVWAWDARPFPAFPALTEIWSDGENWARGHWITGRTAAQPLASVVAEVCAAAGLADVDVSQLHGLVRGYTSPSTDTARATLQALMLAYGFDAVERDGRLRFAMRGAAAQQVLLPQALVERGDGAVEMVRAPEAEVSGRVRIVHVEAEADFEVRAAEAVLPQDAAHNAAQSELPLVLTEAEARGIAERWLAESRVARDAARFTLPPSSPLGAGDVVALDTGAGSRLWRIDRVDWAGALEVEALRVEPGVYEPSDEADSGPRQRAFLPPVPMLPVFMDLPLISGEEVPHAPHLAVTATPWPGVAAVFSALEGEDFTLNRLIEGRAAIGITETSLDRVRAGVWDRAEPLRVRMLGASLSSASEAAVLAGANAVAIGDGSSANWEVFQFAIAEAVGDGRFDLSLRLRGQLGSDALMPETWPAGSLVVMLDEAPQQIELPLAARGLARVYRVGPATRPFDDPSYVERSEAFEGVGLRPYSPAHLRARKLPDGALDVTWIRRTRIDGDSWAGIDVPLGEAQERYLVRVLDNGEVRRQIEVDQPHWTYGAGQQAQDGVVPPFGIAVAQLSQEFGAGPFALVLIDG